MSPLTPAETPEDPDRRHALKLFAASAAARYAASVSVDPPVADALAATRSVHSTSLRRSS